MTVVTSSTGLRGLIVDWGGVLTAPLDTAMTQWAHQDGVDFEHFRDVMREWVGRPAPEEAGTPTDGVFAQVEATPDEGPAANSPVHLLERGQITVEDFERELALALSLRGSDVPERGLLTRLLSGLRDLSDDMLGVVRRAHRAGLRTALLSNSWGDTYPEHAWEGAFDAVVISGRIGMRKPDAEIYLHTADLLGLPAAACVMVDDLAHNVRGAVEAGMVGVLHRSFDETVSELEALFELPLRPEGDRSG